MPSQKEPGAPKKIELLSNEQFWADNYDFLKKHGYQLRPRYQPGTEPSTEEVLLRITDRTIMDAIRMEDNKKVCLKRMSAAETMLTREISLKYKNAPGNHAVRVYDFIPIGDDGGRIAVMPFLREFDDPQFTTVGEILEAVTQFVEGLAFMHHKNFAHRDACWGNMMMDASELVPNGWHIARPWSEDGSNPITFGTRSSLTMKYHFIDFGLSVSVKPSDTAPLATGVVGQDRTVPELQTPNPSYDPFKLDIYQLGNAFKTRLVDHYNELDLLVPLTTAMTQKDPADRPTAAGVQDMLEAIVKDADPNAPVTLKPGVRIWGSNPPGADSEEATTEEPPKKGKSYRLNLSTLLWLSTVFNRVIGGFKRVFRSK